MPNLIFVTGNQNKADYLAKFLDMSVGHQKVELHEIQSTDLHEIVSNKLKQAYEIIKKPVLVEDVSLEFEELNGLPGPFIKWFLEKMPLENICKLVSDKNRNATARCVYGYFDGTLEKRFEGYMNGKISNKPAGDNGFGWDPIFIPEGFEVTRASLDEKNYEKTYTTVKPLAKVKEFLETIYPSSSTI